MTLRSFTVLAAGAALLCALPSFATVVEGQSFETMAQQTPLIVRGVVGGQEARWDEAGRSIRTYTELIVRDVLKGEASSSILVRQPGGVVGKIGARVSGAARFTQGEEVLLFLESPPDEEGVYIVRGLSAGKVTLGKDALGQLRATRDLRGIAFYVPESGSGSPLREVGAIEDLGPAEQFVRRIRIAIAAPAGGAK